MSGTVYNERWNPALGSKCLDSSFDAIPATVVDISAAEAHRLRGLPPDEVVSFLGGVLGIRNASLSLGPRIGETGDPTVPGGLYGRYFVNYRPATAVDGPRLVIADVEHRPAPTRTERVAYAAGAAMRWLFAMKQRPPLPTEASATVRGRFF